MDANRIDIEFTGERVVPGKTFPEVYREHIDRYIFAGEFVKGKYVLDMACGTGYGIGHVVERGARRAIGADISIQAVQYANHWYGSDKTTFLCSDGARLPFCSDVFDIIMSFETIEHVYEYEMLVSEFHRVLKKGGMLICSTPNKRIFSPNEDRPSNRFHVREFWPVEFEQLLRNHFCDITLYGQCDVTLADNSVERDKGIHQFIDNEFTSSGYVVAVARKAKGGS